MKTVYDFREATGRLYDVQKVKFYNLLPEQANYGGMTLEPVNEDEELNNIVIAAETHAAFEGWFIISRKALRCTIRNLYKTRTDSIGAVGMVYDMQVLGKVGGDAVHKLQPVVTAFYTYTEADAVAIGMSVAAQR